MVGFKLPAFTALAIWLHWLVISLTPLNKWAFWYPRGFSKKIKWWRKWHWLVQDGYSSLYNLNEPRW